MSIILTEESARAFLNDCDAVAGRRFAPTTVSILSQIRDQLQNQTDKTPEQIAKELLGMDIPKAEFQNLVAKIKAARHEAQRTVLNEVLREIISLPTFAGHSERDGDPEELIGKSATQNIIQSKIQEISKP